MKRFLVIAISALIFAGVASAQPRAIGVRLGGDAEVSYQHSMSSISFLEGDMGITLGRHGGYRITGMYDFVFGLSDDFNLYLGPGAQVGMYNNVDDNPVFGIGVGGQLGVEYQISSVPINLTFDWRPVWSLTGNYATWSSAAFGVRYRF